MVIKRRDFQKAAAFIHEFLLKLSEDVECAELRDTLNLALLHMQKYYRLLQSRSQEKNINTLSLSARGLSPMTPFVDAPDKFRWRWVNLDNARLPSKSNMSVTDSINLTTLPTMIRAVKAGNIKIMQELIDQDPSTVDHHDGIGRTALMYAVHHTEHNALNLLLESRADFNAAAHDGSTALHYACHEGNEVALSLLLDHGADTRIFDVQGRAPIHWAVATPATECLELLLDNDVDPAMRDKDGLTTCMWACRMDNIKHFELLCRPEYNVAEHDGIERDVNGRTWMHWAVRRTEPLECLQTLLTPESACYKDEDGKTVLMVAAEIGSLPATRLILEIAGPATVDHCDSQARTALHLATIGGHGDVVNFLLEQGADINQPDRFNATAWDYARNRQLHYCQLIIMSHQRQRIMSNPTSPLPNGFGLLMQTGEGVQEDFSRMNFGARSERSTPITPPHPPKRPRTDRMLSRRANSLTTPKRDREREQQDSGHSATRQTSSAGHERKKERLKMAVNTRQAANSTAFAPSSRQNSEMTDDVDMMNVMNDVEINDEDDIDNVSVGGMDVSDIEDNSNIDHQQNGHSNHTETQPLQQQVEVGRGRPLPAQRPQALGRRQHQPRPPGGAGFRPSPPPSLPATTAPAPSFTRPLEPQNNQEESASSNQGPQSSTVQPLSPGKSSNSPQAPPRPTLRTRGSPNRGHVPSPPNNDPQRPHMIRQQQPLPPQPSHREPPAQQQQQQPGPSTDAVRLDQVVSPPLSSGSDQVSSRTQISVGVGPSAVGNGSDPNRPNSGGTSKSQGVAIEGRKIPPPMLTPLPNAPKLPMHEIFAPAGETIPEQKKKKKKKKGKMMANQEKDAEARSLNPMEIPPPRGFAAPLHPQHSRERGHSAALHGPKYSKGQPHHSESSKYTDEMGEDGSDKPPAINGFAVPIREGTMRSARPGQRSAPMEVEEAPGPAGDAGYHAEGIRESIAEEDELGELGGTGPLIIPPPQGFRGSSQQGGHPMSQSMPQDHSSMRMQPTSAKPPLPRSNRNSASSSYPRRSNDKNVSPGRRSRPPTSKN
ncbi:uncharacterized protein [Littorina saxatilis]|uniref:Ankyrin repeat protein n=1 Tax=Littorina saxatilis TaxID=31220 RepID=A0AAN9FWS9_9CAEN